MLKVHNDWSIIHTSVFDSNWSCTFSRNRGQHDYVFRTVFLVPHDQNIAASWCFYYYYFLSIFNLGRMQNFIQKYLFLYSLSNNTVLIYRFKFYCSQGMICVPIGCMSALSRHYLGLHSSDRMQPMCKSNMGGLKNAYYYWYKCI